MYGILHTVHDFTQRVYCTQIVIYIQRKIYTHLLPDLSLRCSVSCRKATFVANLGTFKCKISCPQIVVV